MGVKVTNNAFGTLSGGINSTATTIPLTSVVNMPSSGKIKINDEIIEYTSISGNNIICPSSGRGADDTTAASHTSGDAVTNFVNGADDILEASFRNDNNIDVPLSKIARSAYQDLSNKTSTGQTSQYFVQRFIDKTTLTVYPTADSTNASKDLHFYYVKRIQDADSTYTDATDVPYRFVPCMASGLAFYLAQKFNPQIVQQMKLLYEDELARALAEDGSSTSTYITPKNYYPNI